MFPKPGKRRKVEAFKVFPDGREVCADTPKGKAEYKRRLHLMTSRQLNRCAICRLFKDFMQFDHEAGRGMNGSHRDDRIWKDAENPADRQRNAALCEGCNGQKGSKRYAWQDGIYAPTLETK